jgi:hypothetical protein
MGFGREIEQLRRRANKAAIHTRMPDIKVHVINDDDPYPEDLDMWSIVITIEGKRDYYGEAERPLPPILGEEDP